MNMIFIILGALFFLLIIFMGLYNSLIGKKNQVKKVFGGLDALLKKRWDLIPNLVSSVQQYMKHEADVLKGLTELRTQNSTITQSSQQDTQLTQALGGLKVAVENYPELKASQNFIQLQGALNEAEEQISAGRRALNAAVEEFNNALEMFPSNMMAGMMGLKPEAFFAIPESERQAPSVKNLFQPGV